MPAAAAIGAGFGSDKVTPKYLAPGLKKPLTKLTKGALSALDTGGIEAQDAFNAGTAKQVQLVGDQEGVLRSLLAKRMATDPTQLLQNVGKTAFSFIDPNVVAPLAKFDVNSDRLRRMAAGLNPAAIDSTANRLRDARVASGRYMDTARQVYGALPNLYNQVFNAGVTSDEMAGGYLPTIMSAYRRIDRSPLEAAELRSSAADSGAQNVMNVNQALKTGVYGYQKERNIADRLGAVDESMMDSTERLVQMASQVAGMMGGEGGGGEGGGGSPQMAGGTKAMAAGGASATPAAGRFIPAAGYNSAPAYPGYSPGSVNPYPAPAPAYNPYQYPSTFG